MTSVLPARFAVQSDKPAPDGREQVIGVLPELDIVSAKSGEVFYQNDVDPPGLCVFDQTLNARTFKIRTRVPVVAVCINQIPATVPHILLKQEFLILNGDGFPIPLIVVA